MGYIDGIHVTINIGYIWILSGIQNHLDPVIEIQWSVPGGRSVDLEAHEVHSPRRIRDFVGTHGGGSTGQRTS